MGGNGEETRHEPCTHKASSLGKEAHVNSYHLNTSIIGMGNATKATKRTCCYDGGI